MATISLNLSLPLRMVLSTASATDGKNLTSAVTLDNATVASEIKKLWTEATAATTTWTDQ